eukprot:3017400-Alexandrium_andersonii.AAC.1
MVAAPPRAVPACTMLPPYLRPPPRGWGEHRASGNRAGRRCGHSVEREQDIVWVGELAIVWRGSLKAGHARP